MPMTGQIVIKKEYFDNIKTSIDSLNSFFSSGFKNKDFPIVDTEFQLDGTIMNILSWLNNIEPSWIDDPSKVESTLKSINDATEDMDGDIHTTLVNENRTVVLDQINAFIGFKVLQFIADHFSEFSEFVNAIYTFELFTKPSHYISVISLFSQTINLDEIADIMGEATYTLFDGTKYVTGIFSNDQIKIPQTMKQDTEISRFNNMTDIDVEIVIDESIQEAAEVNYFSETKPQHIKYDERTNTFKLSKQLQTIVDGFISGLEKCDTTEDLVKYFRTMKTSPDSFTNNVIPFILVKVFNNTGKYPNSNFNTKLLANYVKSYKSIATQNTGARRFMNYDLFSTFKTDKDGTIAFMKDFLSLDLFNNPSAYISNNTLLTIFNIFDSRIYLDILYNLLSDKMKKSKYPSEDAFVKEIRARINKNSHSVNVYKKPGKPTDNKTQTTKTMNEYAVDELRDFGDMSITDMQFCEQYHAVLMDEINGIGDAMYNKGVSQTMIDSYIGESYQVFGEGFFSDLFGKKKNKPEKDGHTISELEEMYGTSFPQDFVEGIGSEEYKHIADMVSKTSVKINVGSDTHEITCLADVNKMYDWNSEIAEPGIEHLTFVNIGDDDIGVHVKNGTYHIVYGTNEASKPFAKSFKEFMSKLDIPDTVQEGFFSKLKEKKIQKNIEKFISELENRYGVKVSEDYRMMLVDHFDDKRDIRYGKWFHLITPGLTNDIWKTIDNYFKALDQFDMVFRKMGLYPILDSVICPKDDGIFSDESGNIYSSAYNQYNRLEKVAKSITEFLSNYSDEPVYYRGYNGDSVKKGLNKFYEIECYYDDYGEYDLEVWVETFNDGRISPKAANMLYDDDIWSYFSECLMQEVIPLFVETYDRKYIEDSGFDILDTISKIVIKPDGTYECYFKYKGKELSFKDVGVDLSHIYGKRNETTQESYYIQEQETGDIPDYMKNRIDLSDETGGPKTTTTDVQLPPDVPANDFDDLADSVNARMDGGDSLEDCLGSGYNNSGKDKDARIVYNITNNYHNSFNRDSNNTTTTTNTKDDHSTGKSVTTNTTTTNTNSNNDSSTNKTTKTDNSNRKVSDKSKNSHNSKSHGVNNNNNSNGSDDTKEIKNVVRDGDQTFSTGHTIQEVFAFLESEEPLSERGDAGKPPKGDLLTTAMDKDRETLSKQQAAKQKVQKVVNTGKALLKPVTRTKQWLTKMVDSLIKRDEDRVKAEIIESPSYRTSLYKAMRIALKLGLTGVCFTISGYLGAAYLVIQGAKAVDKQRLRKEVQEEFATEIKILDDKIRKADEDDTPESRKAKWQMMRLRSKMEKIMSDSPKSKFRHPNSVV